jgi:hypothetical protein
VLSIVAFVAMSASASGAGLCRVGQVFNFTGGEQSCVVPPGVAQIAVDAVGARGGSGNPASRDGSGFPAEAFASIAVAPGTPLYFEVGGRGGNANSGICPGSAFCGLGGFNGGGISSSVATTAPVGHPGEPPMPLSGGGGGGASDVRTMPRDAAGSAASRLLVAAGAGGDGGLEVPNGTGGQNGHGGTDGTPGTEGSSAAGHSNGGSGGGGATSMTPGTGGAGGANSGGASGSGQNGGDGDLGGHPGAGGYGGPTQVAVCQPYADSGSGGGGGGGLSGGGGGGGGGINFTCDSNQDAGSGGGGGGGSSYAPGGFTVPNLTAVDGKVTIVSMFHQTRDEKVAAKARADARLRVALDECESIVALSRMEVGPLILARAFLPHNPATCAADSNAAYEAEVAKLDPPDHNFHAVALPGMISVPGVQSSCRTVGRPLLRSCLALAAAFSAYDVAVEHAASLQAAANKALNRGNTATAAGDGAGVDLQSLTLIAFISEQATADRAVSAAGRTLARALHKAGLDIRQSPAQAALQARLLGQAKLPGAVLRFFAKIGIAKAELRNVLSQLLIGFKPTASRLTASLATPRPAINVPASDLAITTDGLAQLVRGLVNGGGLTATQGATLYSDATHLAAATAAARRTALNQLKADARRARPAAAQFLTAAIGELS